MSKSQRILIGLGLGIFVGLFFGDACAPLKVVGTIFIKLMQMTVMPYIILSLILGIGRLSPESARRVAGRGLLLLVGTWGIGTLMLLVIPLAFPEMVSSSYYSGPTDIKKIGLDSFIELFIPSNIFRALSEELIPSVILFCICLGLVLMRIPNKDAFIKTLETLAEAVERLAGVVATLMPVGVFAMAAVSAGTMTWTEISRLQVYVASLMFMSLFSVFWLFPMLIRSVLPVSYRELLRYCKEPLLISFTSGSFVALPLISSKIRELMRDHAESSGTGELTPEQLSYVDVVLPIAFAFPTMAGFFDLLFIRFTAWSYDIQLGGLEFAKLVALGIPALFSEANSIPFLLQQFHLPMDSYNLYLMSGVIDGYFFALLNGMCLWTVTLLCVASVAGRLKFQSTATFTSLAITVVTGGAMIFGLHSVLTYTTRQTKLSEPELLTLSIEAPAPTVVSKTTDAGAPREIVPERGHLLEDILKRRVLRVAYSPDGLPWSYVNLRGDLVGYDIAFAHQLAKDMGVALELVPIDFGRWTDDLEARKYDIAAVAFSVSPDRMIKVDFSMSHRHLPSVFVVKDYRKEEFSSKEKLAKIRGLRIAVLDGTKRQESARNDFPDAQIIPIAKIDDFFNTKPEIADAWYTEAGKGYAYSLLHPVYDAVLDPSGSASIDAYPIPKGEPEWQAYLNSFLRLQRENGFETFNYEKYVLGKHFPVLETRWCIARDVLHWMN